MNVTIDQQKLAGMLTMAARAVAGKAALPVLTHVKLDARDGRLTVAGTDLTIGITTSTEADVSEPGTTTVDAKTFLTFVNGLGKNQSVTMTLTGKNKDRLQVTAGAAEGKFGTIDASDFPATPETPSDATTMELKAETLVSILRGVERFAATDDSRPVLATVHLVIGPHGIAAHAADGFQLAAMDRPLDPAPSGKADVLIPLASARTIAAIASAHHGSVTLRIASEARTIALTIGDTHVWSALVEGNYPDVDQIIPRQWTTSIKVDRESLTAACKRAEQFARENNDVIRVNVGTDKVTVRSEAGESGSTKTDVPAEITGPELQLGLNVRYVISAMSSLATTSIAIGMNGPQQAVILIADTPADSPDSSAPLSGRHRAVVMPMILGSN